MLKLSYQTHIARKQLSTKKKKRKRTKVIINKQSKEKEKGRKRKACEIMPRKKYRKVPARAQTGDFFLYTFWSFPQHLA